MSTSSAEVLHGSNLVARSCAVAADSLAYAKTLRSATLGLPLSPAQRSQRPRLKREGAIMSEFVLEASAASVPVIQLDEAAAALSFVSHQRDKFVHCPPCR